MPNKSNMNLGIILLSGVLTLGAVPYAFSQTSTQEKSTKPPARSMTPEQGTQKDMGPKSDHMQKKMTASRDDIRKAQQALKDKGMYDGAVDGTMNAQFEKALSDYQTQNKIQATGKLDHQTMIKLGIASETKATKSTKTKKQGAFQAAPKVREVQQALKDKGFEPGPIDGIMGAQTQKAIAEFQRQQNLYASGRLDPQTEKALGVGITTEEKTREKPSTEPAPTPDKHDQYGQNRDQQDQQVDHSNDIAQTNPSNMGIGTASSVENIRQVQIALKNRGYYAGDINGMLSTQMQDALRKFQAANNLPVTGVLDDRTQAALGVVVDGTSNPDTFRAPMPDESANFAQKSLTSYTERSKAEPAAGKVNGDERDRAMKAADVLQDAVSSRDKRIPEDLLERAEAVAVIPNMIKGAFGIGGRYGKGLLSERTATGQWGAPTYITIGGGSFGAQIGVSSTDLVLIFTDKEAVSRIENGMSLTLGADAAVVAGPIGRAGQAGVTGNLKSAVYAYSRSKGLFAGVALDGAVIDVDEDANHAAYGSTANASTIMSSTAMASNANVQPFVQELNRVAGKKTRAH
jgi:lipid-binding SYLF domain-containing protein